MTVDLPASPDSYRDKTTIIDFYLLKSYLSYAHYDKLATNNTVQLDAECSI